MIRERFTHIIGILILACTGASQGTAQEYTTVSVLNQGQFVKLAVSQPGIYKIDAGLLSNAGFNPAQINAAQIRLWSNGGGVLPQRTDAPRVDDLQEVHMYGVGLEDGKLDPGDYLLFYAEGPDTWEFDPINGRLHRTKNIYDSRSYYFLGVNGEPAQRMTTRPSATEMPDLIATEYDAYQRHEDDLVNLLGKYRPPGSGQRWFGDEFSTTRQREYTFQFPDLIPGSEVRYGVEFAGRSDVSTQVIADFNGKVVTANIGATSTGTVSHAFARITKLTGTYIAGDQQQKVRITYPAVAVASSGWLDYIELQAKCDLRYRSAPLQFRSIASMAATHTQFVVSNMNPALAIWDITDAIQPVIQEYGIQDGTASFVTATADILRAFVTFQPGSNFPVPSIIGPVENQNLHGIQDADLVIIYHRNFEQAASRLADHRLAHSGYFVEMVRVDQIFNEFGGGGVDPTAIRDFARMLYKRSDRFRYLLLLGDASYDQRHINKDKANENFIPVYQTPESMDPINAFPSDDYYALLDDQKGETLFGIKDIAVGRIPVTTPEEANAVINKIIQYDANPTTMQDWRLRIAYVADDEDSNLHLAQTEDVATTQKRDFPVFNAEKIYLDAYQQISTPGGARYPDVNRAINNAIDRGVLVMNYFGHGGPSGWAQERVLTHQDIQSWSNYDRLPLLITATCHFASFDEPSLKSAGENILLNPAGGAIALLTTVRDVYAGSNKNLVSAVFDHLFALEDGAVQPIGDVMRKAKNSLQSSFDKENSQKFAIIGDPSMRLAIPEHRMVITGINGRIPDPVSPDTIRALEKVTLAGELRTTQDVLMSGFNGIATVTVFDKPTIQKTLANDPKSRERDFETQTKILFRGRASVSDGKFEIEFVLPQDINFSYGHGKVSMYATDGSMDAAGHFTDLVIGGHSDILVDNEGPEIRIYADHEGFVSGDETGPNPVMIIKLFDESGINVTGGSIGHDLEAILNGDQHNRFIFNDRYVAAIDDYRRGEVRLPLRDLEPGRHTFQVTAWDIANNFSVAEIEFVVVENPKNVVRNLKNYPNPFVGTTRFIFDHSLGDAPLDLSLEIFSMTGELVGRVIERNIIAPGGTIELAPWDGRALNGLLLSPGTYFYALQITRLPGTSSERSFRSDYNKLIFMH